jgi:hypothetical protein
MNVLTHNSSLPTVHIELHPHPQTALCMVHVPARLYKRSDTHTHGATHAVPPST